MLRGREDGRWRCCKEEAGEDKHIKSMLPSTMGINSLTQTQERALLALSLAVSLSLGTVHGLCLRRMRVANLINWQVAQLAAKGERRVLGEEEEDIFKAKRNE